MNIKTEDEFFKLAKREEDVFFIECPEDFLPSKNHRGYFPRKFIFNERDIASDKNIAKTLEI